MNPWFEVLESWLSQQYREILGLDITQEPVQIRWLASDSLSTVVPKQNSDGMVLLDNDIGWMLFLLRYEPAQLEHQANKALSLRSQLLRESNYSGETKPQDQEDANGSWRVGLVWLVADNDWQNWQDQILKLRRESGIAEEITIDAIQIVNGNIEDALVKHGLPRLLLKTRSLLKQSAADVEEWRSADAQIRNELKNFSQNFSAPNERAFARELEEKTKSFFSETLVSNTLEARPFRHFCVRNFRNLTQMEIVVDQIEDSKAQAIVLFGPNGTGKSSFAEALTLAAFGTSPRLEAFLEDKDLQRVTTDNYQREYLIPLNEHTSEPCYEWDNCGETPFKLACNETTRKKFTGTVLNQEDSIEFTKMNRDQLAATILKGYSTLADHLLSWLSQEENRVKQVKIAFTSQHGLTSAITRSATAYDRLANILFSKQLQRPSAEFIDWLRFLSRMTGEDASFAKRLLSAWTIQQENAVNRLAGTLSKLQEKAAQPTQITLEIHNCLVEFDKLAIESFAFWQQMSNRVSTLHEQISNALTQIDTWGIWLTQQQSTLVQPQEDSQIQKEDISRLAKERTEIEQKGKSLRARLDLLDQTNVFLQNHWSTLHPDVCPVCNSDVSEGQGIVTVINTLRLETDEEIKYLRVKFTEIQKKQQDLETKLKSTGQSICPLAMEDQARLKELVMTFFPAQEQIEDWLINAQRREQLKSDLARMKTIPGAPKNYADPKSEAERLSKEFITLTQEADGVLEAPQSIGEVRKAFEKRLEKVLQNHLPSTLGKVWEEIALTLTTASWLLPDKPVFKLEQRGKTLSVQAGKSGRYIRYLYNAAERHILGLAWFFTYYLSRKRFEDAWILLDDPAQEMDQPSYREFVRFLETLLRLHRRTDQQFTVIAALNQEERALDMARATNGKLHILGWKTNQQDKIEPQSVKKVVLLAPGFHPLKPTKEFFDKIAT